MIRQPITDIKIVDGIFVKSHVVPDKHTLIPQHAHSYAHVSFFAVGSFHVWAGDEDLGVIHAPHGLTIKAKTLHRFLTLTDNATFFCIHSLKDAEDVEIHAEHELTDESMAQAREILSCQQP